MWIESSVGSSTTLIWVKRSKCSYSSNEEGGEGEGGGGVNTVRNQSEKNIWVTYSNGPIRRPDIHTGLDGITFFYVHVGMKHFDHVLVDNFETVGIYIRVYGKWHPGDSRLW